MGITDQIIAMTVADSIEDSRSMALYLKSGVDKITIFAAADSVLGRGEEKLMDGLMGPFRDADRPAWAARAGSVPEQQASPDDVKSSSRDDGDSTSRQETPSGTEASHPDQAKPRGK